VSRLRAVGLAVWDFVVGDDWRTAVGVALALGLTALVVQTGINAWWLMPVAVTGLLAVSLRRAAHVPPRTKGDDPAPPGKSPPA
jgi:hypothetical protein